MISGRTAGQRLEWLESGVRRYGVRATLDGLVVTSGFMLANVLRFDGAVNLTSMGISALLVFTIFGAANVHFGLHRRIWRYASVPDALAIGAAVATTTALFSLIDLAIRAHERPYWLSTVPNGAVLASLLLVTVKLWPRLRHAVSSPRQANQSPASSGGTRVLIVGAGQAGTLLARDVQANHGADLHLVGFVDDDQAKTGMRLGGVPVLGTRTAIPALVRSEEVDLIAIAIPSSLRNELDDLVVECRATGARVQIVPSLSEMATQPAAPVHLRELDIADLLGREEVRLDVEACARYVAGKVVLVTGAAGSIGSELCRQLTHLNPSLLVLLDTNETGLFDLEAELRNLGASCRLAVCMADIRDEQRVARAFAQYGPQVVFHAAAYKHVPLLESHPAEAVKANVLGTAVLCRAAHDSGVERFVFISSDKAVAAANNLGYSKRIGELLVRAYSRNSDTIFCAVRFGNVVGSRGSVVPTFERQIAAGGPVTVTHPEVTRFFMSIPEAACLVIQAAANAHSGSIFMLDMGQPISIVSLAEKMIRLRGLRVGTDIAIAFSGLRPGEKMHEELTTGLEDTLRTEHAKITEVIDPRFVSREGMESAVRTLVTLARDADDAAVSDALRRVSQGEPLAPAYPRTAAQSSEAPFASVRPVLRDEERRQPTRLLAPALSVERYAATREALGLYGAPRPGERDTVGAALAGGSGELNIVSLPAHRERRRAEERHTSAALTGTGGYEAAVTREYADPANGSGAREPPLAFRARGRDGPPHAGTRHAATQSGGP